MRNVLVVGVACVCVIVMSSAVRAAQTADGSLRYEVENYTTPKDAWQVNKSSTTKWNLWSTDKDADKKWSGGVVLQSPSVKADRATGEEGAPVLHTVITGISKGTYDIDIKGTRPIGISFDGKKWQRTSGGTIARDVKIDDGRFELWVDDRYAHADESRRGSCYYDYIQFSPTGSALVAKILGGGTRVDGWAKERRKEDLDRGVVALRTEKGVYVGWRLLEDDPQDVTFDIYRGIDDVRRPTKINSRPISVTTDYLDTTAPRDASPVYYVRVTGGMRLYWWRPDPRGVDRARTVTVDSGPPYVGFKLAGEHTFQKVAVVDLNGDGSLDYVVKHPNSNIDPWHVYWKPSPETYKVEAYLNDGTRLWTRDLGWAIERGIWYSPYVACDLDGDGRAEVAAKTGEGDPRNEEGKVTSGPEYLTVWDGMTGKEIARAPWPSRDEFMKMNNGYNYASRNQMAVAYLDGKTPCLIALRGTYNLMKVEAYQLVKGKLELLWRYSNEKLPRRYRGQGAHFTRAIDVDNDGRDEVMLGSVMLDDTGVPLWTTGLGHNDHAYVGDIDPHRPGVEIYYGLETRASKNGMCMVDAPTGKFIWGFGEPTRHIHSSGMCADIDPTVPGMECFGLDCISKSPSIKKGPWLWAADGTLLWFAQPHLPQVYGIDALYWDADLQKEILRGSRIRDYQGGPVARAGGRMVLIADVLGDWREEIIATYKGEMRIYTTTIPATDRRACLLQDRVYRSDITMDSMGYTKEPMTSYNLEAHWPGLNLTAMAGEGTPTCRAVVSAPVGRRVTGRLVLEGAGLRIEPGSFDVDVEPGGRKVMTAALASGAGGEGEVRVRGAFSGSVGAASARLSPKPLPTDPRGPLPPRTRYDVNLRGSVTVKVTGKALTGLPKCEAESIGAQGGGQVRIRDDKKGTSGKAISHWDDAGHWLEYAVRVPRSGAYEIVVRYCAPHESRRALTVDGKTLGACRLPATGGFGSAAADWEHATLKPGGKALRVRLDAGRHAIRLENVDGQGVNLDYVALRPVK